MQVCNVEAERKACDVRLRAERRVGQLLQELTRATASEAGAQGGRGNDKSVSNDATSFVPSPYAKALVENGISRQSANRYEKLAAVPETTFEQALAARERKSTQDAGSPWRNPCSST